MRAIQSECVWSAERHAEQAASSDMVADGRGGKGASALSVALSLLCILPITTLFQSYGAFSNINKAIVLLVLFCLVLSFFKTKFHPAYWLSLLALAGLTCYDLSISTGQYSSFNDPMYLAFWFLLMMIFSGDNTEVKQFFKFRLTMVQWVVGIWTLLVGISIFLPSSYGSGWGDGTYFGSFAQSIFRLAPCCCLIQVFLLLCLGLDRKRKTLYLLCQLVPLYCGYMGGSRTYFAVIARYFLVFLRFYADTKGRFYCYMTIVLVVGIAAVGFSGLGSKISATQYTDGSYRDFWGTLTNGRTLIWGADLQYYLNADSISVLFGSGYDKVYELSLISGLGDAVYAHNDFLNLVIVNGAVGLLLYTIPVLVLLRHFRMDCKPSAFLMASVFAIWMVNAFFNMNYTYTCAAIALGLLPTALSFVSASLHIRAINVDAVDVSEGRLA